MPVPGDAPPPDLSSLPEPPPPPPPPADGDMGRQFDFDDTGIYAPPPPPRVKIALPPTPLDVTPIQSGRERELLVQLETDETFAEFMTDIRNEFDPAMHRRRLLRNALKVTRAISPPLIKLVETVRRIVKCPMGIELFVEQGEMLRSWSTMSTNRDIAYIGLTSAMIEKIPQRELLFVLGSEIGHLIYGHYRYPIEPILARWRGRLAPIQIFKLLAWKRYADISADRVGLLCCQDYQIASDCLFKLTTGVTTGKLSFNLQDYLQQLVEVKQLDDVAEATDEWFSSQPFSPLRIKALELFGQTDLFQKASRRGVGTSSFRVMEEHLDEFMAILFPSFQSDDPDLGREIRDWMLYAALLVAYANGVLDPREVDQIVRIFDYASVREKLRDVQTSDPNELFEKVAELVGPIRMRVIPAQRCQMMRDLIVIAAADGEIDEHEFGALFDLGELLEVPQDFIESLAEEVLTQMVDPFHN